MAIAVVAVL
jgi:hypothetical protein